jgi:uncharacterized protein (TIGR03083 family)
VAATISRAQWVSVRAALRDSTSRFASLVGSVAEPGTMVTAEWNVADAAAHVAAVAWMYTSALAGGDAQTQLARRISSVTVDTVAHLNNRTLRQFTERDPRALAARLRSDVDTILEITEDGDPELPVPWLGESRVPLGGVLAHLSNELIVHGWDIARALGRPWPMPRPAAGLFFDLFVVGMIRHDVGHLLDNSPPPRDRRVAIAFRSFHTRPVTLVLHRGRVSAEDPGGPVDARVAFDPTTMNLLLFGRVGRLRAVATGRLFVAGRRPWLLPVFLRTVRLPTNAVPLGA